MIGSTAGVAGENYASALKAKSVASLHRMAAQMSFDLITQNLQYS